MSRLGATADSTYPLRINNEVYYIAKRATVKDEVIFRAICNGIEIELTENAKQERNSNTIDI